MNGAAIANEAARAARRRLAARVAARVAMGATIAPGLASRRWPQALPAPLGRDPGDTPWASMAFFGWRARRPCARPRDVALPAAGTSVATETAKRWQAPGLVAFRHKAIGHRLLGHVLSWQQLVADGVGIPAAAGLDRALPRASAA